MYVKDSINTTIGGITSNAGNIIANASSGHNGVEIIGTSTGTSVLGNTIYNNGRLGIDLGNDRVTPNDTGDSDTGPNNLQNFPVLTHATIVGGNLKVRGSLNSTANTTFRIEVFANSAADSSGYGEGQRYLGSFDVTTDGSGNVNFAHVFTASITPGEKISATATNLTTNNTSEFAQCYAAAVPGIIVTPTGGLTTTEDGGTAGLPWRLPANPSPM